MTTVRAKTRTAIAKLWLHEIERQPMSLVADDGTKALVLSELTIRILEDAGYAAPTQEK